MATAVSRDTLNKETNARFWAQTNYKPGQRLDPNNATDKAMMPVWMDIFHKVQREADAGTLVTTFDHPVVAQNLADAEVANRAAAVHAEAAATSTDPWAVQGNTAAATTAAQIAAQKAREAAAQQPPTVSPAKAQDAAKEAAKSPPPPSAPAADHIAHAQTQTPAPPAKPGLSPDVLYKETNTRFWNRTHYKPGQKLDMSIPEDKRMAKIWVDIYHDVQREANAGTLQLTSPELVPQPPAPQPPTPQPQPPVPVPPMPWPTQMQPQPVPPTPWPPQMIPPWMRPGMGMPPQGPMRPMPGGMPPGGMPGGAPQEGPQPGGAPAPGDQQGMPMPTDQAPPGPQDSGGALATQPGGGVSTITTEAPPPSGMSTGVKVAIALGIVAVAGGAGYWWYTSKKKAERPAFPRARAPRAPRPASARAAISASPSIGALPPPARGPRS